MGVGGGDLDRNVAGLTLGQILEVRAGGEAERGAGDGRRAFARLAADRIGQARAVVVAVHIRAKRCQIDGDARAIFDSIRRGGLKRGRIVGPGHRDCDLIHSRRTVRIGSGDLDRDIAGLAIGKVLEVRAGVKAERGPRDGRHTCCGLPRHAVGQRGPVVVTVHVRAERRQIQQARRAVFIGGHRARRQGRCIVAARHGDIKGRGRLVPGAVLHHQRDRLGRAVPDGEIVEIRQGIEGDLHSFAGPNGCRLDGRQVFDCDNAATGRGGADHGNRITVKVIDIHRQDQRSILFGHRSTAQQRQGPVIPVHRIGEIVELEIFEMLELVVPVSP
ncbi:hypothetical protein TRN7648_03446 [Tropicibacter naphthalenivorans]|uniref:Uncharacterized protein n=1 Tax=Tropicibacter naphthalenivorans TaxID=441103 RepID=A0A0P1GHZ0_9RHOB|nr:hypothetical protein TRN7648_03446 [Tropicibacter naphthalenivorans]